MRGATMLCLPALRILQGTRTVYLAACDGKRIHEFAAVSRIGRDDRQRLGGYQRPESAAHIRSIRRYLESGDALMPHALVLAFDERVRFQPTAEAGDGEATPGMLIIPVDERLPETARPAWLVDGQQRAAALRDADVDAFPVPVIGFVASQAAQRAQFILVNTVKPLPKGWIHELLPETGGTLPALLARKRLPGQVMVRLNTGPGPFADRIRSPTAPDGYIRDTAVLTMIESSLYDGALYQYRNHEDGSGDIDRMVAHLNAYWATVHATWPHAWELPPRRSRLTHGAGIRALGFVMDHLTEDTPAERVAARVTGPLAALRTQAAWTSGRWRLTHGTRHRRDVQNTGHDIRLLTDVLLNIIDRPPLAPS
ncbi:DGQHR domain-containing protein DpdB [Thermomonospora umbrina]|uniref:DGQHR domain-containing protein n=1 Tax=Thermomonospora umbrina TaxID=111806 RepID=A0A3D9T2F7_9ACTN|nr:DGQHR domain-containing protein DpdB [Thermomonospora umbrina]REF00544.1 DGQHR domain-containing protein [Thermomonospora umbrina]